MESEYIFGIRAILEAMAAGRDISKIVAKNLNRIFQSVFGVENSR